MERPTPGYHGCYLRVDVSNGTAAQVPLDPGVLRRFLGGSGLATWLLLTEGAAECEPLSPAAPLVFAFSPLVGSPLTTSAKFAVGSKSPLTQRINDSLSSSQFAIAGKRTGHDALVIVGRAASPSVLIIDEDRVRLEPAGDLWGKDCTETERRLKESLDSHYSVAVIGPAGERRVPFATLSHDGRHAGRGGSGAVLGAKNVKAIAVRGERRCSWAHAERLVDLSKELSRKSFGPATAKYRELGTAANLLLFNRLGALPTRNFQAGSFAGAAAVSPEQMAAVRQKTRASCAACTIGCEHLYSVKGDAAGDKPVRMEYENLFALGPLCGIDDPDAVLAASRRCDELGLDTISAGGTIAFAMECVDRGLLPRASWLRFGDGDALLRVLDEIGQQSTSLGKLLGLGSRRAAEQIGGGSIDFAPQVKGMELPGYEPRALQTMALGLAVGSRGADHNRSGAYEVDFSPHHDRRNPDAASVAAAVETEDRAALIDTLILCKFLRGAFNDLFAESAEMLHFVTGWDLTATELRRTAKRIVTAKRAFNERAGWEPHEDMLPGRFFDNALPGDPGAVLARDRFQTMIEQYNLARGLTCEGWLPEMAKNDALPKPLAP